MKKFILATLLLALSCVPLHADSIVYGDALSTANGTTVYGADLGHNYGDTVTYGYLENEVSRYLTLLGSTLTSAQVIALNANIRAIKYGSGITLSSVTSNRSDVDGAAFITNPSVDLRPYVGFKITGSDGSVGWIKAAGTGETLGDNIYPTYNFTTWRIVGTATVVDADSFSTTGAGGVANDAVLLTSKALYKSLLSGSSTGSASLRDSGSEVLLTPAIDQTGYATAKTSLGIYIRNGSAGTTDITSISVQQVLTPSSTGVTIVSTQGGAAQNWITKGTTPNAATLNYTITRD